eukprot:NODE_1695_length_556_cov_444.747535_g1365_i0.p1 GENE.NODE_1695_length_556_cov_444.747535_g1365_i0~~NODE_1695_length_556_cov_444.747535_g1365_i0.p1  ORF type:complete len:115 (+),score=5.36 NODE_1695_length_556_cov_444.747535_g1365_i0:97-441(+)
MFGAGCYFATEASKSNQYAFGLNSGKCLGVGCSGGDKCKTCQRHLLLCAVAMGREESCSVSHRNDTTYHEKFAPAPGYDSVHAPADSHLQFDEFIVYFGSQAYPQYLVTYNMVT